MTDEHRAGQIVRSAQQLLINAGVAHGRVHRRRIYAFELLAGIDSIFTGHLPAVDVFAEEEVPVEERSRNQLYDDMTMELITDLYVVNPDGDLSPELDKHVQQLRLAIERVIMGNNRNLGLDYVIDVNRASAAWQSLEREGSLPVAFYRLTWEVTYRTPITDPAEV